MGLIAVYPQRQTSKANPEHRIYPYWLRDLTEERPHQALADQTPAEVYYGQRKALVG